MYFYSAYNKAVSIDKGMEFDDQVNQNLSSTCLKWQKITDFILNSDMEDFRHLLSQSNNNLYLELKEFGYKFVNNQRKKNPRRTFVGNSILPCRPQSLKYKFSTITNLKPNGESLNLPKCVPVPAVEHKFDIN